MINIEDFAKVEIRAGKILSVEEIDGSEKLLKLSVDFGEEGEIGGGTSPKEPVTSVRGRQVISGIKKYFEDPQALVGITCAFVTNLEPRSIMGLESQAMIMAASDEDSFTLLKMDCPAGSKVK
ncbi:MAG: methionine--tRNA ligase subunit beta [Candidatus Zambryskibacteria bacterium CG10_big_fil_rev_8_21_14_0_10_34_34]|uniref:Methionine--tRNA ligase subunit beta n=1 Tax=Candidatus Zambryskibacteria bacterium CG10_big_fil_rev_8_21_14_0_10_34_34 TaxID=1975114 RepID=A0A2H0R0A0_9BACT|nr:MAG: methionine--tRNA ligase subunit beta [Candidatus Zambryskibacteria bacterium CG10_big_fil_rev_8_21_14_0_10_34_34]